MNYNDFIEYNKTKNQGPCTQKHHIIPLSAGGPDTPDNIIILSWSAHWWAHKLLAEENPDNKKIQSDFKKKGTLEQWIHKSYMFSKKGEEPWNKGKTGVYSKETLQKMSLAKIGTSYHIMPHTEETKKKISESLKGKPSPNKGKTMSKEIKEKISTSLKGRPREYDSIGNKGMKWKLVEGKRYYYREEV